MTATPATAEMPDPQATYMRNALEQRGIACTTGPIDSAVPKSTWLRARETWLRFSIRGRDYGFATGMLVDLGQAGLHGWGQHLNHRAALMVSDKYQTKMHLAERGFGVPVGQFFRRRNIAAAYRAFDSFSGPICVKPNNASKARCVYPGIVERRWYDHAIAQVSTQYATFIAEESVEGEHYRFFYVEPDVVGICHRRLPNVLGDGQSTIAQLIEAKNKDRLAEPEDRLLDINDETRAFLAARGLSLDQVPARAERVTVRGVANARSGADSVLQWDELHPSYRTVVAEACASVPGLRYTGVDIVIKDPAAPAGPGTYWIIELNCSPTITSLYYPPNGPCHDVAGKLVDMLLAQPHPQDTA